MFIMDYSSTKDYIGKTTLLLIASLGLIFSSLSAQIVTVGTGSYTTSLPSGEVGPQNFSGANALPKVSSNFNQHVQTNDFWSSLIYPFFGSDYSTILYAHPLNLKAVDTGLELGYTSNHMFAANDFLYPYSAHLTVGVSGMTAAQTLTESYGDWTVSASWEDGSLSMEATLGHGLPYAFFRIYGGEAIINTSEAPVIWYSQDEVLGITVSGKHYGVFAPTGSSWSESSPLQSNLNGLDYLSVALLPDTDLETLELFRSHAYAFVTNSIVDWNYNEQTSELTSTYSYETVLMDNAENNVDETLTALYRHQWLHNSSSLTDHIYHSPRGEMKLSVGSSFTVDQVFQGVLPTLPDRGNYNREVLLGYVQDVATETLPVGPTYENGKLIARFSHLVHIADQLGAIVERDHFIAQIKSRLEEWFTAGGEQEYYFNENWDVFTGYPSGYGADNQINDHHFHASYAVMSAATIAQYDSVWASQDNWGGMVNLLIRDANSWDREDDKFPFLRSFDPYAGHSWAAGHGDFAEGNNQESSSESMNFAAAAILWGEATGQAEIRDMGIYLYTTETEAVEQYWFDVDNVVFPQDYPHVAIGMVWGGKGVHSTWFGADPEFIHGINILPMQSGSLYLGRQPEYVIANYEEVVAERNDQPVIWQDILWEYLALADPNLALSYYYADEGYEPFDGESRAHTLHWLYNMKKMGHVDVSITANIPTYAVFQDAAGDLTYVAYNAGSTERLVTFSDGFSMSVAPKETAHFTTAIENPDAPIALLLADRTSGKVPLHVEFTGSNSFDPNGSSLSHVWDFGDGTSSSEDDPVHIFQNEGSYVVYLTVENEVNISAIDSVTITVLGNGTPYLGTPFDVPGIIEAEYYDLGGEGVAYHDNDGINWGVPFRSDEGVDIEGSGDVGGGYNIGWIEDGEWLEYTINVPADGLYTVIPRISSVPGGGALHIEFDGMDLTGEVSVPVTGGWQFWEGVIIPNIELNAGEQVMHVALHNGHFNLNWIEIQAETSDTENISSIPAQFELTQNYPNPFNPATTISYSLPEQVGVKLTVYDIRGQEVITLHEAEKPPGSYEIQWNGMNEAGNVVNTSVYFCRLEAGSYSQTIKMLYLK